jgi:hypothetical protein
MIEGIPEESDDRIFFCMEELISETRESLSDEILTRDRGIFYDLIETKVRYRSTDL